MRDIQNVCLIDASILLINAFKERGCTVLNLRASPHPFFDLPTALAEHGFVPDLVFQSEDLGPRSIVTGLGVMDCPVLFWAIDPHLNTYWQSAYSRLFDITCSTQRKWIPHLRERGTMDVRWLPTFGHASPWVDMNDRIQDVAFVGRITNQRPARKWMAQFLERKCAGFSLSIRQDLNFMQMMELYRDSKIIPNESIVGEVNFRLFEAASCGCLVLSQDLGDEQAELFEPGREFDTYDNVVEFDEKLSRYLKNPRLVQAMGRAAYERIQAEHLAGHRVGTILEFAGEAVQNRSVGTDSDKWTTLAACGLWEAGAFDITAGDLLARLASLQQDGDIVAAILRVQMQSGMVQSVSKTLNALLGGKRYVDSFDLNLTGSMAALRVGHFDGAKAFWYRHLEATEVRNPGPPQDSVALLTLWAKDLGRRGNLTRAGFPFDPSKHLPAAATECLMSILADIPEHLPTLRLLDTMLRPAVGREQARVGFLSILTLHERNDWRLAFEIALANLKSFRLESGLEELALARDIAAAQGQGKGFDRALVARDISGLLAGKIHG